MILVISLGRVISAYNKVHNQIVKSHYSSECNIAIYGVATYSVSSDNHWKSYAKKLITLPYIKISNHCHML